MSEVIDLTTEYEPLYFICLEDWSDAMKEAGGHKAHWYEKMKDKGLRVKLARDEKGVVCGMIEYLPIEYSMASGQDIFFINCLWVHGHKQGRGDMRKRGYGRALLEAAEQDAKQMGAKGMAAYGIMLPFWIPVSFFKSQGYRAVDKDGIARLMFKPFEKDTEVPKLIKQKKKPMRGKNQGQVTITFFLDGYCPARNIVFERTKRTSAEFGDKVVFESVDTSDRLTFLEWGMRNELFIEDKRIGFGPPLPYEKVRKMIEKQVCKLK